MNTRFRWTIGYAGVNIAISRDCSSDRQRFAATLIVCEKLINSELQIVQGFQFQATAFIICTTETYSLILGNLIGNTVLRIKQRFSYQNISDLTFQHVKLS